jgi:hypothetical protein
MTFVHMTLVYVLKDETQSTLSQSKMPLISAISCRTPRLHLHLHPLRRALLPQQNANFPWESIREGAPVQLHTHRTRQLTS